MKGGHDDNFNPHGMIQAVATVIKNIQSYVSNQSVSFMQKYFNLKVRIKILTNNENFAKYLKHATKWQAYHDVSMPYSDVNIRTQMHIAKLTKPMDIEKQKGIIYGLIIFANNKITNINLIMEDIYTLQKLQKDIESYLPLFVNNTESEVLEETDWVVKWAENKAAEQAAVEKAAAEQAEEEKDPNYHVRTGFDGQRDN
jgi:hypothetical protein